MINLFVTFCDLSWWPLQRDEKYVFQAGPDPGKPPNRPEMGAPGPQISSDYPRKSSDFEIGVGDRLGTLRVSRSRSVFSI